ACPRGAPPQEGRVARVLLAPAEVRGRGSGRVRRKDQPRIDGFRVLTVSARCLSRRVDSLCALSASAHRSPRCSLVPQPERSWLVPLVSSASRTGTRRAYSSQRAIQGVPHRAKMITIAVPRITPEATSWK